MLTAAKMFTIVGDAKYCNVLHWELLLDILPYLLGVLMEMSHITYSYIYLVSNIMTWSHYDLYIDYIILQTNSDTVADCY